MQKSRLERLHGGRRALKLLEHPARLLSTILVGNTIVNTLASSIGSLMLEKALPGSLGMTIGVFLMTFILLVFGEVTPKVFASANAVEVSRRISGAISMLVAALSPVSRLLAIVSSSAVRLSGGGRRHGRRALNENDIISLLELGMDEGVLGTEARVTVSLMTLGDSQCREAMIPRAGVAFLRTGWTRERILEVMEKTEYTRYPLLDSPGDRLAGIVDSRDVLPCDAEEIPVRHIACFPENAPLDRVLDELRTDAGPMGAVFDEYGDWTGLVTLDDILEFAVFHSMTGSKDLPEGVHRRGRGFSVPGSLRLDKLSRIMGVPLEARFAETCAGLLQELTGRIPSKGEVVTHGGLRMTVLESSDTRIGTLLVEVDGTAGGS